MFSYLKSFFKSNDTLFIEAVNRNDIEYVRKYIHDISRFTIIESIKLACNNLDILDYLISYNNGSGIIWFVYFDYDEQHSQLMMYPEFHNIVSDVVKKVILMYLKYFVNIRDILIFEKYFKKIIILIKKY